MLRFTQDDTSTMGSHGMSMAFCTGPFFQVALPVASAALACLFEQIALKADRGQELRLRLRGEGQAPELDEAEGGVVVKLVAGVIGRQAVVVERVVRFAPDDGAVALRELDAHRAADETLRTLDRK